MDHYCLISYYAKSNQLKGKEQSNILISFLRFQFSLALLSQSRLLTFHDLHV